MAIDNPAKHNLRIRRGRDYSKIFNFTGDFSAYTAEAEIRESSDYESTLVLALTVVVGSYAAGVTPITVSATDAQTLALSTGSNKWDLALTTGTTTETYVYGTAQILNAPTDSSD